MGSELAMLVLVMILGELLHDYLLRDAARREWVLTWAPRSELGLFAWGCGFILATVIPGALCLHFRVPASPAYVVLLVGTTYGLLKTLFEMAASDR